MKGDLEQVLQDVRAALKEEQPRLPENVLTYLHPADLAEVYTVLDDEERSQLFFILPPRLAAEVIAELDEAERGEVVDDLDNKVLTRIVTELAPDDAVDVLGELTEAQREEVLDRIPHEQADQLEELLEHAPQSAGGIMTPELVAMPETATVGEAIEAVRRSSEDEEIHYVHTIDKAGRLTGLVPLRQLVLNPKTTLLSAICKRDILTVHVNDDQELVANKIRKYDVSAVPVVDDAGRLVGRVTHDDIMDVAHEEAAEDLYYMAGTEASELEEPSVFRAAFIRLRWLMLCLLGTAISGLIVAVFKRSIGTLEVFAAMVLFVPMMGAMGGNSGIQISTIVTRSLATGELVSRRAGRSFARELPIALLMAPACAAAAAVIAFVGVPILQRFDIVKPVVDVSRLSISVAAGMGVAILTASILGMSLPHLFRRIGVDPAIASGPIVTTANDIVSVTMYFLVGMAVMGGPIAGPG